MTDDRATWHEILIFTAAAETSSGRRQHLPPTLSKQLVGRDSYRRNGFVHFKVQFCEFLTGHAAYEIFQLPSHQLFLTFSLFFWNFWWTTFKVVRKFPKNRTKNVKANMNTWKMKYLSAKINLQ